MDQQPDEPDKALTADDVRWAYRVLLDREPESDIIVTKAVGYKTRDRLRSAILASPEYRNKNAGTEKLNNLPLDLEPLSIAADVDDGERVQLYNHIREKWTSLGEDRPHWSVLSSDKYRGELAAEAEAAFYQSGEHDLRWIEAALARAGRDPGEFRHALEYGCGVGRVSLHLARRFAQVTALDISPSHLGIARSMSERDGGLHNITFTLAELPHFGLHDDFDLFYSRIVLQHNPPPLIKAILRRALGFLKPGGIAIFQVPTYAVGYSFSVGEYLSGIDDKPDIEMHCLSQSQIFALIDGAGCRVREVREDNAVDIPRYWVSNTFVVEKRA